MKSEKLKTDNMKQLAAKSAYGVEALQNYLQGLYDAYDAFQTDYKRMHKRSRMHNSETVAEYYLRWRDSMRNEISRIEMILMKRLPKKRTELPENEIAA